MLSALESELPSLATGLARGRRRPWSWDQLRKEASATKAMDSATRSSWNSREEYISGGCECGLGLEGLVGSDATPLDGG